MNNIIFILFFIVINLILFLYINKISKFLKLYDYPDNNRKIHKSKVPLIGGIYFFINITFYLILENFVLVDQTYFSNKREIISIYFGGLIFFLMGVYDDKNNLNPNTKLILSIFAIFISISLSNKFIVNDLNFLFYEKQINLDKFSIPFTIFCILVFLNAFNMIDGINGLSISYFLICTFYLLFISIWNLFFIILIICSIFFLYYNFKNKIFLGDSGSLLLGFILALIFIKSYNEDKILADQIIILMILPGIDLLRVAISRILKKKHAFEPDRNHLHHILMKKFNNFSSYILITTIILTASMLSLYIRNDFINLIGISLILAIYFLIINNFKSK